MDELPEVIAAAEWWANILREPAKDESGDPFADVLKNVEARRRPALLEATIEAFTEYLRQAIAATIEPEHWRYDNPNWGSGMRGIHNDYQPDRVLQAAAGKAGIDDIYFRMPWKTDMWINPGEVKVARGHGNPIEQIYPPQDK